jgi:hypothetical protein
MRYVFRNEPLTIKAAKKANPQVIGEALAKIAEQQGGRLTPEAVVEAARSPRHPLHKHFEWDDQAAAAAFRLDQARGIIRIVRVEDDDAPEGCVRAFLSVADKGTAYRGVQEVRTSVSLQTLVLRQAERDLEAFERRYRELTEICDLVRVAREALSDRLARTESRVAG